MIRRSKVILHYDSFSVEDRPTDHMNLCLFSNPIDAIGWELNALVVVEQEFDAGDEFFLPSQVWNGKTLPETTWTVGTMPNGLPMIIGIPRRVSMFHVMKAESLPDEWVVIEAESGNVSHLTLDWLSEWDGFVPTFEKMLPLQSGDIVFFHPFPCYHPDIPGINRLRRFIFLPPYRQLEPLTPSDAWNPDLD